MGLIAYDKQLQRRTTMKYTIPTSLLFILIQIFNKHLHRKRDNDGHIIKTKWVYHNLIITINIIENAITIEPVG